MKPMVLAALLIVLAVAGCGEGKRSVTPEPTMPSSATPTVPAATPEGQIRHQSGSRPPPSGVESYQEQIIKAPIIVRASLTSAVSDVERHVGNEYVLAWVFTFQVHEYLKGSGGNTITAFAPQLDYWFTTEALARANMSLLFGRDARWDGRQAILFLRGDNDPDWPSTAQANRYMIGIHNLWGSGDYPITSEWSRRWLPEVASSGASGVSSPGPHFLLDESGDSPAQSGPVGASSDTLSLAVLKQTITTIATEVSAQSATERDLECVRGKYWLDRYYGHLASQSTQGAARRTASYTIESGSASGSVLHEDQMGIGIMPDGYGNYWTTGQDAAMFSITTEKTTYRMRHGVADTEPHNRFFYKRKVVTVRPLTAGTYTFETNEIDAIRVACGMTDQTKREHGTTTVTVTAPSGTAYEAMFDPTTVDGAVKAASVLKPYTATGADAATVSDISWKSGTLKIKLDPVTAHTGHVLNFIDVDGDVALSLALSGATVDAAAKTLSWTVTQQPWKSGDKMMLRISPAPPAPAAPAGLTAAAGNGSVTLTWNASTDSTITRYEYQMRWAGVGWGEWKAIPNSGPATASHVVTGLTNGTEYRFHLRAVNVSGGGTAAPDADPWYVKATPAAPLPAAPSGLAATAGKGSVRLTWSASTDSTITRYEYQVRWAGVGWGEWTAIPNSGPATTSYVVTGLTGGTEYRFHLRAVNATGAGTVAPNAHPWYVSATPTAPSKRD